MYVQGADGEQHRPCSIFPINLLTLMAGVALGEKARLLIRKRRSKALG